MAIARAENTFPLNDRDASSPPTFCLVVAPADLDAARLLADRSVVDVVAYSAVDARNRGDVYPPSLLLGLLALSSQGRTELEIIREHWAELGYSHIPEVVYFPHAAKDTSAEHWLQARLFEHVQRLARRVVELQQELGTLRALHEETQNAFENLEELTAHRGLLPVDMSFVNEGCGSTVSQPAPDAEFFIEQLLPVSSQGLIGVELHLVVKDPRACGALNVVLSTIEDSKTLAAFDVLYESIRTGWNLVELETGAAGPPRSVQLRVGWNTIAGKPPSLSLGSLQVIDEFCASSSERSSLGRSIAIRTWRGLPGVRPPSLSSRVTRIPHTGQRSIFGLPPTIALAVEEISPPAPGAQIDHVKVLADGKIIQVHPRFGCASVARLPSACPLNVRQASAHVHTNHPNAGQVEYAMAVVPRGYPDGSLLFDLGPDASVHWSGWVCVDPNTESQVHVFLTEPTRAECDVLLATRTPANVPTDFCWAQWSRFIFSCYSPAQRDGLPVSRR